MKVERWVFTGLAIFLLVMTPIYWLSAHEIAGALALGLAGLMSVMIAGYVLAVGRRIDARPEDDKEAEVIDGAGTLGFFPPTSIWPFWCGVTVALICLGAPFGWWLSVLGVAVGIWAASGWAFQFYRGEYAH
ncbi:cytochrome c oxidase subunit 4 [Acidipropionibacterium jensenii]|uniref:cytochrome c oxidase subunit 4 n=1 Tax=Acidipropionibacterium jensenii TaxID=1749 RepID=UPI000BC358E5|nr:cytochrome c oxidase subunit 4 [Acidipropionibacterium jensenii]AZZ41769.1 cytochrome c oxidase subunit 4 [Acidipropionibacterium jensenii]